MHAQPPECRSLLLPWTASIFLVFFAGTASGQIVTLTPSLSLGERYDDNIFEDNSNVDDFITTVSPGVLLRYVPMRDTELNLEYKADFEFFADHTEENYVSQRGLLRFAGQLTRSLSVNVRESLIVTEEPNNRTLEIDEVTGLRPVSTQGRQRTLRNSANMRLDVQLAPRVMLGLLFENLIDNVDTPQEVDEYRYTIGTEFGYLVHLARASRAYVAYDVTFHNFSQNAGGITAADFNVHAARVGFRHAFSPTLSGNVAFGYSVVTSDDPTEDGNSGINADLRITKTFRTGQATFAFTRDFTSGGGEGGSVIANVFTASFTSQITPKVTAGLGTNLSFYNFQQATGDDRLFWLIRSNLAYQILRFWRLSLDYDYALINYDQATTADEYRHRLTFISQFALKEQLLLNLSYRYTSKHSSTGAAFGNTQDFNRNEVMLTLTYAPTFRF
jgi:hypothetical protein